MLLSLLAGCWNAESKDADHPGGNAGQDGGGDGAASEDSGTDTGTDADTDGDSDTDVDTDTDSDTDADTDADADSDIPDGGIPPTDECVAAGGRLCTEVRWEVCPPGTEPIDDPDAHRGCGQASSGIAGWCCQNAPKSPCTSSAGHTCVPGTCQGCWGSVPDLACESGRSCCTDMCN